MHSSPVISVLILIRLSNRLGKQKSGFPLFSRPGRRHIKWYVFNLLVIISQLIWYAMSFDYVTWRRDGTFCLSILLILNSSNQSVHKRQKNRGSHQYCSSFLSTIALLSKHPVRTYRLTRLEWLSATTSVSATCHGRATYAWTPPVHRSV
jgi:hypothetical protein